MAEPNHDNLDPGLAEIARLLREERTQADPDLLERTRVRVRAQARRPGRTPTWTRTRKDAFMRSRIAITATLTVGILMMATSSGLALSGIAGDGSAGTAQYPRLEVLPGTESGEAPETLGEPAAGEPAGEEVVGENDVQGTRQVSLSGDSADKLPFTGFAAIFLLAGGLALLTVGLVLRRGLGRSSTA